MAQSVTLWGASYSDVPALTVPKTGGGTARFTDTSVTTAVESDVASGKIFIKADGSQGVGTGTGGGGGYVTQDAQGYIVLPSTGGGSPSATQHEIYFEFSDSTNTTIDAWYDDSFISNAITATTPTTYGSKTVTLAQLDGVTWYEYNPSETWETLLDGNISWNKDDNNDYPYCWISSLSSATIPDSSVWRITYDNVEYRLTAVSGDIGNPKWGGGTDDGSNVPFVFENGGWGAWTGSLNAPNVDSQYYFKIERLITS